MSGDAVIFSAVVLSEFGCEKFKPLIEKYALLHNIPTHELLEKNDAELYHGSAFGKRSV